MRDDRRLFEALESATELYEHYLDLSQIASLAGLGASEPNPAPLRPAKYGLPLTLTVTAGDREDIVIG